MEDNDITVALSAEKTNLSLNKLREVLTASCTVRFRRNHARTML